MHPDLARASALIRQLQGALGGHTTRSGSSTVTWGGSSRLTAATTVTHGLPAAPTVITFGSGSSNLALSYGNITATTFDVTGNTLDGTSPANGTSRSFSWTAWV